MRLRIGQPALVQRRVKLGFGATDHVEELARVEFRADVREPRAT